MVTGNELAIGSLAAIAQQTGASIAETFMNADAVLIIDSSSSMETPDSRGGRTRFDVACEELRLLQETMPGRLAVISFSSEVMFCPNGIPYYFGQGTDMVKALEFARVADVPDMRFILVSDGEPFDPGRTIQIAKTYRNKIDVIYVGPEEHTAGRDFLYRLAGATGGASVTIDRAKELKSGITYLLGE